MTIPRLPDAELVIMNTIWRENTEMTSAEVIHLMANQKDWSVTTISTFLSRLAERGFLTVRKNGRTNIYKAAIQEDDYIESESKSFLKHLHGNSLTSFVAALYKGKAISKDDLDELKAFIDGR